MGSQEGETRKNASSPARCSTAEGYPKIQQGSSAWLDPVSALRQQ